MVECRACGTQNPEGFRFCGACASPLDAPVRGLGEERKVVTSLFCDLVGFTATSELADPEDVDRMLASYFAMARKEIEACGGVVEKFIGDAVVGVFGVPATHEDDPERAVRAGLRIAEAAEELTSVGGAPLKLRVGINTGIALVRLGIAPSSGAGFLLGDSVNTAARIQSVAPEMGVAVGLGTYEATSAVFAYEELPRATLKGKSQPVRVFWAKSPVARFGVDVARRYDTPFVGREIELSILKGVFERTVATPTVQLVTVLGEPGLGKSRIVAELGTHVDALPDFVTWRQGRCLPYGEGITFSALREVVKGHAGILESDDARVATAKLDVVLPPGPEREWFRQRLLPLLGVEASSTAEHEELFTAWSRFFEHVAEQGPTVIVFEDLHWADQAMLAFLEHLADRADGVPLLVVGTARPELLERHPGYTRGLRNVTPISLTPLSAPEATRLLSALLDATLVPAELQAPILERSGGNPLFAEEFVRLLKDKELLVRKGSGWALAEGADIPFPESLQALIAARLDTLTPDLKAMLADAAVVGKIFWAGAVAAMGALTEAQVTEAMRSLAGQELVRRVRRSSVEGQTEYAFWHVLARDVAYAQLPRSARASRHVAVAAWIESNAAERTEDVADVLAYHYTTALELARATGQTASVESLEASCLRYLTLAGERALDLDATAALDAFERALALTPEGHPLRPETLARFGQAALQSRRLADASEALEEAIAAFRERGDVLAAARAMDIFGAVLWRRNDPRIGTLDAEAVALLEPLTPGPELLVALADLSAVLTLDGRLEEGLAQAERALRIAAEAGLPPPVKALGHRGMARCSLGDSGGLQDFRDAVALAIETGRGRDAAGLYNNLGIALRDFAGPRVALETFEEASRFAEARGLRVLELLIRTSTLPAMLGAGELEGALTTASRLAADAEEAGDEFTLTEIRGVLAIALTLLGRAHDATGFLDRLVDATRRGPSEFLPVGLGGAAIARAALGQSEAAASLLHDIEAAPDSGDGELAVYVGAIVRTALALDQAGLAERLAGKLGARLPYGQHARVAVEAALAEARGETAAAAEGYADAAARWGGFGVAPEEGFARLGQGRCLLALSRPGESAAVLGQARAIFARSGMRPARHEADAWLHRAAALGS